MEYVLSQVFVTIYYFFVVVSYQMVDRKKILLLNIASLFAVGISYFFLSAYSGLAMTCFGMVRNVMLYCDEKRAKTNKVWEVVEPIILLSLLIALAIFSYSGILSLLPVASTFIYTVSIWQKNTKVYKLLGIPVGMTEISYNVYIKSVFGVIFEMCTFLSAVTGYIREYYAKSKKKEDN